MRFLVRDIIWDVDAPDTSAELGLPTQCSIKAECQDDVIDILSDTVGFCIKSCGEIIPIEDEDELNKKIKDRFTKMPFHVRNSEEINHRGEQQNSFEILLGDKLMYNYLSYEECQNYVKLMIEMYEAGFKAGRERSFEIG